MQRGGRIRRNDRSAPADVRRRCHLCLPGYEGGRRNVADGLVESLAVCGRRVIRKRSIVPAGAALFVYIYSTIAEAGTGLGSAMRWVYERFQQARNGTPYPIRHGKVPPGSRTPTAKLGLQAGELVKIKDYRQILETLDQNLRNRGLYCDPEIVPYCNRTYRVLRRVEQIIDEKTGVMLRLKNDALILDGLVCQARYAKYRRLCPRGYYQYMREIWLERVDPGTSEQHLATEVKTGNIASTPEA